MPKERYQILLHLLLASLPMLAELLWQPHPEVVLGVEARNLQSWPQVFTAPFAHADFSHLFTNLSSLWVLGAGTLHFFPKRGKLLFWAFPFLSSAAVWLWARPVVHLGASGWVFALAGLLLMSGFRQQNKQGLALSIAVSLLYSGVFVGIFPTEARISWESHLSGFLFGLLAGLLFTEPLPNTEKQADMTEKSRFEPYPEGFRPIETSRFKYVIREED